MCTFHDALLSHLYLIPVTLFFRSFAFLSLDSNQHTHPDAIPEPVGILIEIQNPLFKILEFGAINRNSRAQARGEGP